MKIDPHRFENIKAKTTELKAIHDEKDDLKVFNKLYYSSALFFN